MLSKPDYRSDIYKKPFDRDDVRLTVANICTAFDDQAIGSKFTSGVAAHAVVDLINGYKEAWPENGQAFIPAGTLIDQGFVLSGDAPIPVKPNVDDWHLLPYRGKVDKFLRRGLAESVEVHTCNLVVYTYKAYLNDPDVCGDEEVGIPADSYELSRMQAMKGCTHVLIAVLASGQDNAPTVSPFRFVANLAGGNNDYKNMTMKELVELAGRVRDTAGTGWATVADNG